MCQTPAHNIETGPNLKPSLQFLSVKRLCENFLRLRSLTISSGQSHHCVMWVWSSKRLDTETESVKDVYFNKTWIHIYSKYDYVYK